MSKYIFQVILKHLVLCNKPLQEISIGVLGITYKENCPDIRNSKAADMVRELLNFGLKVFVSDPIANNSDVEKMYGFKLFQKADMQKIDCLVISVAHDEFKKNVS
ncbi:MAG: hypothetical protein LBH37_04430 [Oscillospiraceae bacterium]|nr:hypothetical protein [Oscillospiraceae bacterium]